MRSKRLAEISILSYKFCLPLVMDVRLLHKLTRASIFNSRRVP